MALFGVGSAEPGANRSAIIEFLVDDVDVEYERLRAHVGEVVTAPTTMPWGNRALLFRDPDGNLVNLFTPVTDDARAKFGVWRASPSTSVSLRRPRFHYPDDRALSTEDRHRSKTGQGQTNSTASRFRSGPSPRR